MTEQEKVIMQMISYAGVAKSSAFEAIHAARNGKYEESENLIQEGNKNAIEANKAHFSMLREESKAEFSILLMHAEDQMITSQLVLDLAVELIEMYKKINAK